MPRYLFVGVDAHDQAVAEGFRLAEGVGVAKVHHVVAWKRGSFMEAKFDFFLWKGV